jgi:hypothetical protein
VAAETSAIFTSYVNSKIKKKPLLLKANRTKMKPYNTRIQSQRKDGAEEL